MRNFLSLVGLSSLMLAALSCGKSDKEEADVVVYGSLKTTLLASTDVKSYALTSATCANNIDSGLFTGTFGGEGKTRLVVRIKGFTTPSQTYTCTQASDNKESALGGKYNICAVEFTIPDISTGVNTYNMYREVATDKPLNYNGACTVTTQYTAPKVTLKVNCAGMIQTLYQNQVRFPVDPSVTANVDSTTSVECNI